MNKETFKQTYLPLSASMYRTAYRILGNPEDAEDMVQEAYMKLWKQRDTLDGILDARAYAVTSVKNLCLDTIRKQHLSYEDYEKTERTIAAASTPYTETIHSEEAALLHRYIDSLEEPQHTVVVMRDIGGYSFEEIASVVQLKEAHIRMILSRARRKLRELYIGEFYQFNLSSCIRQQNSLTAQFVSFSLANLANIFYPPRFLQ